MISGKKTCLYVFIIFAIFVLFVAPYASAITIQQLADICQAMESSITDVSVEYEWYIIPPGTPEEVEQEFGMPVAVHKDGISKHKLSISRTSDVNDPNHILFNKFLSEESAVLLTKDGDSWNNISKKSYNGTVRKLLMTGGTPRKYVDGLISYKKPEDSLVLTPLGFSVFRLPLQPLHPATTGESLSDILRRRDLAKLAQIDNTVGVVNGFRTVRVDFLDNLARIVFLRVYFSIDHGYTPVKYEYVKQIAAGQDNIIPNFSFEVHSLEKVREGLWFPTSGLITDPERNRNNGFQTTAPVIINQGLKDEHFDIQFPPGARVLDEINNREYIIKPSGEQFD